MKWSLLIFATLSCTFLHLVNAQSTFIDIKEVFETKCGTSNCHNSIAPILIGEEGEVFNNIVKTLPTESENNHFYITPGYPERSTLYNKLKNESHIDSGVQADGDDESEIGGLTEIEMELLRQWIYYGAPETGEVVDKELIEEYYTEGGLEMVEKPEPPSPEEGFQVYFGPIFVAPGDEVEFLKKWSIELPEHLAGHYEVNRMELFMNDFSHHFIIYRYDDPAVANTVPEGMRPINLADIVTSKFIAIWQGNDDYQLPDGTAYIWNDDTVLDFNYHVKNYSTSSVLAADLYINIYVQPTGTAEKAMISDLAYFLQGLYIPPNSDATFNQEIYNDVQKNLWMVSSHTHQYGRDYDVYLSNNGEKGLQIFEGLFNTDYTQFTGVYDYEHPPVRYFDDLLELPPGQNLIHEAYYENTTENGVGFGLTTEDEMFITIYQYTVGVNHQENFEIADFPKVVCIDDEPFDLFKNGGSGVLGNGIAGDVFDPNFAGLGVHELVFGCCEPENMTYIEIEVVETMTPVIFDNNGVLETTPNSEEYTYQWFLGGEEIEGANTAAFIPTENGDYAVEISGEMICTRQSDITNISTITNIENHNQEPSLSVYPNPFSKKTNIFYTLNETANVEISVVDIVGKKVATLLNTNQQNGKHQIVFDADKYSLASGIYWVELQINNKSDWLKVVVN